MTYAFLKSVYGADDVDDMMNLIEYAPHTDPHWDPFSIVYDVSTFPSKDFCDNKLILHRFPGRIRMNL